LKAARCLPWFKRRALDTWLAMAGILPLPKPACRI